MTRAEKMHKWFREIWDEREDEEGFCFCFETGRRLDPKYYRSNTACYDHVLEQGKTKFPQYAFLKKNIVILHPDIHTLRHSNIDKTPKVKEYRAKMLSLHYENKLEEKYD